MLFNSYSYPVFLILSVLLFWSVPSRWRLAVLFVAGVIFYASHSVLALLLISGTALVVYAAGQGLLRGTLPSRRVWQPILLVVLLFILLKYSALIASTIASIRGGTPGSVTALFLPLGISFFTFEFIHYLTDIHRGEIREHGFWEFMVFTFFYPTLVSGPIKRFEAFTDSLRNHRWNASYVYQGCVLILLGYAQKYILADPLIPFTEPLGAPAFLPSRLSAAMGLVFYSFRIYFDFAGLSNIAIGSALLFGILVPKNFSYPYLRPNIQLFWNNWHMSLSSWVRDYIYITLGGSRRGAIWTLTNLLLAMLVVGIWHGASWNFAVWGVYHGMGLVVHRLWLQAGWHFPRNVFGSVLGVLCTFLFVTIGWAFFVTSSLTDSLVLLQKIFL